MFYRVSDNSDSVEVFEKLEGSLVRAEPDFLELLFVDRNLASSTSFKRFAEQKTDFEQILAVQTDIEPIRYQKLVFRQNIHGKKCSLGHEETFFSWKFSPKIIQQKDTINIQGCYNENQGCHNEKQQQIQPNEAAIKQNRPLSLWNPVKVYSKSCSAFEFL